MRRSNVGGSRPEVPLWNVGSPIRSLPPIARGFGKNALGRVTFIGELEPPGLDSNPRMEVLQTPGHHPWAVRRHVLYQAMC